MSILKDIAQNDTEWSVRRDVIEHIDDESFLKDIAQNDTNAYVRENAIFCIDDESFLKDIAKNALDYGDRRSAIQRMICESKKDGVRFRDCIDKINDESFLKDIAKNDGFMEVRHDAVMNISDESFLKDIAKNDSENWVRLAGVSNPNLRDEKFLEDIILNDTYAEKEGVWSIKDERYTGEKRFTGHYPISEAAVKKINDETILTDVIAKSEKSIVCEIAKKKLEKQND